MTEPSSEPLLVDVQHALSEQDAAEPEEPPSAAAITAWACAAYAKVRSEPSEVTIRLTGENEITELNHSYRDKNKATNVLSFPVELDFDLSAQGAERFTDGVTSSDAQMVEALPLPLLGDVVICHPVIVTEAAEQGKSLADHYAHMVTHGILHLCGYDHQDQASATVMESLETQILAAHGVADPY